VGGSCQACERFWAIHHDGVLKNQPVESTWSLHGLRESKAPTWVLQQGLVESLSDTSAKHHHIFLALILYILAFTLSTLHS